MLPDCFLPLPVPFGIGFLGFPVDEHGDPVVLPKAPMDGTEVTVTAEPADPKAILAGRVTKPAPGETATPVEPTGTEIAVPVPSQAPAAPAAISPAKAQLLQRNVKPAPAIR
jgi:hypothetical protein